MPQSIFQSLQTFTADMGYELARYVRLVQTDNLSQLQTLIESEVGPVSIFFSVPWSATGVKWVGARAGNFGFLLLTGLQDFSQAAGFANGYAAPNYSAPNQPVNSWVSNAASDVFLAALGKGLTNIDTLYIGGHSAGGAVGELVGSMFLGAQKANRAVKHTFGSPRWGGRVAMAETQQVQGVRWMYTFDPIPLLPLRFEDAPWFQITLDRQLRQDFPAYVHARGGVALVPGKPMFESELPPGAVVAPFTSLASWIAQWFGPGGVDKHGIDVYVNAIFGQMPVTSQLPTSIRRVAPEEEPDRPSTRLFNEAERQFVNSIATAERRQNAVAPSVPSSNLFVAVRLGRVWVVQFGGTPISYNRSKRSARALAKLLNYSFKRLLKQAVVDPDALSDQFQNFLNAAQNPSSGIVPTMNTSFT